MSKHAMAFLLAVSLGAASAAARAADAAAPSAAGVTLKVAVVDSRRAIAATEAAKAREKVLQERLKPEADALNKLGEELKALDERARRDGEVMAEAERGKLAKELEDKKLDYQFRLQKLQKAQQDALQELLQEMGPRIEAVLKSLVESEGYTLVLERGQVIWTAPALDITARVVERLNAAPASP